ncbi:tubulin-like doman-containing protein [Planctomycetota bacterium]
MKTKLYESITETASVGVALFTGSTGEKVEMAVRKLESVYGMLTPQQKLQMLGFDAEGVIPNFLVPMADSDMDKMTLGPNEFMPVTLPDAESLEKAERAGLLWPMEANWFRKPGVSKDNNGTGGNGRTGHGLLKLNINRTRKRVRKILRNCRDYQQQRQVLDKSEDKNAVNMPITAAVCLSLLGGFGTGTLIELLKNIRQEANELKLPVRIVVLGMCMGSIEPIDKETAARNQEMICRELQAYLVGQYSDINKEHTMQQPLCDSLILISDTNNHGGFDNLDNLISQAAQHIFHLFHTPLGRAIQEKAVDIEEAWIKDELGGQRFVSTMGYSNIHLDLPRIICCVANKLVELFLKKLLINKKQPQAVKGADIVAAELAIAETETKHLACRRLHCLSGYGNANASEYGIAVFRQRCGHGWGFNHCCELGNASSYTLDVEMPQRLKPQMYREFEKFSTDSTKAIGNKVLILLQDRDGLSKATQFIETFIEKTEAFKKANNKKLERVQSKKKSIDDMLGHARDILNKLKGKFWFWRFFCFSMKKQIGRIFPVYTESAVRNRFEIVARVILANEYYPLLQEFLTEQLSQMHKLTGNIMIVDRDVGIEANRLQNLNPVLKVSVGKELATPGFIIQKFEMVVDNEDGEEKVSEKVFSEFQGHYKNLIAFNHRNLNDIKETLLEYCIDMAHRHLSALNAIDVFKECRRSPAELKDLIAQCLRESNGRLRITGEADEIIPTIKFIAVKDRSVGEWIVKTANEIDPRNGEWQIAELNDSNAIVFFQQRCRISMDRLINDTSKLWHMPQSFEARAKLGADPIIALLPPASCSIHEKHAAVAMGLASGCVKKTHRGYELNGQPFDNIYLGADLEEIVGNVGDNYPLLVRLYRSFVKKLAAEPQQLISSLDAYIYGDALTNGELSVQLGKKPFVKTRETADALMPYIRRMPLDKRRSES